MAVIHFASNLLIATLKEAPADAVAVSHQLLIRAGFIRQLSSGLYHQLPLAQRSVSRLAALVRSEIDAIGGQEFRLPSLHPAELWQSSGRWSTIDETMLRLRDRRGSDLCLAMTHEEAFTALARNELRSYRQLPQLWYQITPKFRDEPRPRGGLLRTREFQMQDAYSFDLDADGLDRSFARVRGAYERIFERCELDALPAEAFSGAMGGSDSIEFMVRTEAGEDEVIRCTRCGYCANVEVAVGDVLPCTDPPTDGEPESFPTPGVLTIDALAAAPHNVAAERQLKTLVYIADAQPVLAIVRGDHALSESRLQLACRAAELRPATAGEVVALLGAQPGSLGGVSVTAAPVLVDRAVARRTGMVTGANRDGWHLRGVDVARDLLARSAGQLADIRVARGGDVCRACGGGLEAFAALEVGHIFKLGTRYSVPLSATVRDASDEEVPLVMGSYGIGLERLLAAIAERHHDDQGLAWPPASAPYDATVLQLGDESEVRDLALAAAQALAGAGHDVLVDDRPERAGVKFNDADLIGVPIRVSVGRRAVAEQRVEVQHRASRSVSQVAVSDL